MRQKFLPIAGVASVWRPTSWAGPRPSRKSLNWLSEARRTPGKIRLKAKWHVWLNPQPSLLLSKLEFPAGLTGVVGLRCHWHLSNYPTPPPRIPSPSHILQPPRPVTRSTCHTKQASVHVSSLAWFGGEGAGEMVSVSVLSPHWALISKHALPCLMLLDNVYYYSFYSWNNFWIIPISI